jgi:hypothetical protein
MRNHAEAIAAIDMCVVPMLTFERLFAFLVLGHDRRQLLWFEVTRHPTAEWLARQITEAFPWTSGPGYLVRDNDRAFGHVFTSRVRAMGIRDRPISPGSPWQNGCAERLISTLRRGVPGSNAHLQREPLAASSFRLCGLLQSCAHALGVRERCAFASSSPTLWRHCRLPSPGWTAPPICPDMIFGKNMQRTLVTSPVFGLLLGVLAHNAAVFGIGGFQPPQPPNGPSSR